MNFAQKIDQLRSLIETTLTPLIDNDYLLLDLPYYSNIGDTLIWEGTESYLDTILHNNLCRASYNYYDFRDLPINTVILLQGGGNFGDIWRAHQDFRLRIIEQYPNNKIIILPQTIYYEDENILRKDAELMSKHKNLYICARDTRSLDILDKYFRNKHLLLPDMAFCINTDSLTKYRVEEKELALFLKRTDKELSTSEYIPTTDLAIEIKDWPSMERLSTTQLNFSRIIHYLSYAERIIGRSNKYTIINKIANCYYRPDLIRQGVRFVSSYKEVYTTRLHVAILSTLLHKNFTFIDNSYGKNSTFFNTWLSDLEGVELQKQ